MQIFSSFALWSVSFMKNLTFSLFFVAITPKWNSPFMNDYITFTLSHTPKGIIKETFLRKKIPGFFWSKSSVLTVLSPQTSILSSDSSFSWSIHPHGMVKYFFWFWKRRFQAIFYFCLTFDHQNQWFFQYIAIPEAFRTIFNHPCHPSL